MFFKEYVGYKLNTMVKATLESAQYYPYHEHEDDIEIICVMNGCLNLSCEALDYELKYGDIFIVNHTGPHKILSSSEDCIMLTVHLNVSYFGQYIDRLGEKYFVCGSGYGTGDSYPEFRHIRFILAKIYKQYSSQTPEEFRLRESGIELLRQLMDLNLYYYYFEKTSAGDYQMASLKNYSINRGSIIRVFRIIDHISNHLQEKIKLSDLAKTEYISEEHLSRLIKSVTGRSFSEILSSERCESAVLLLGRTDKNIDRIATEVGFANSSHLASQFRRWYHKSPSEYRRDIRSDLNNIAAVKYRTFDKDFANQILEMYLDGV